MYCKICGGNVLNCCGNIFEIGYYVKVKNEILMLRKKELSNPNNFSGSKYNYSLLDEINSGDTPNFFQITNISLDFKTVNISNSFIQTYKTKFCYPVTLFEKVQERF